MCRAWGNRFLWNYRCACIQEVCPTPAENISLTHYCSTSDDAELQRVFNFVVSRGVNLFDTADSYGTGDLNGRSGAILLLLPLHPCMPN